MSDANARTEPSTAHTLSLRQTLRSFLRDWARWSSVERRAATLILVLVAVAPVVNFLP
ncbi:hypothetical protein [Azospirillum sp. TSH64]|uniref:hypothetical protein n=1 Tax=Azospirillum sp. TSH64 TaxID=652740 RepID=UPI0013049AE6|nr:hypothetical protein [Azospirillum sp. TSH64]